MQDDSLLQLIEEEMKAWEAAMPFVQLFDASTATAEQWKTVSLSRMMAPEVGFHLLECGTHCCRSVVCFQTELLMMKPCGAWGP